MVKEKIKKLGNEISDYIIDTKRTIHQNPELSGLEFKTSSLVKKELVDMGIEVIEFSEFPGILGVLKGHGEGKTILIRADMDALPMQEKLEHPYKSVNDDIMHSCGHDGHTSSLLGAAKILSSNKDLINGTIKFLFQHAEETGTGAKELVNSGVLKNPDVDAVLGYHIMPIAENKIGIRDLSMCASSNIFEIKINGIGGHGAYPHKNINPVGIGARIISEIPRIVTDKFNSIDSLVINVCTFNGGDKDNIVPDSVKITGTIRALTKETETRAIELLEKTSETISKLNGGSSEFRIIKNIPEVTNDKSLNDIVEQSATELFGSDSVIRLENPSMGSEDFGHLKAEGIEGTYFYIGYYNDDKGYIVSNHNPYFDFDDKILPNLSMIVAHTTVKYLNK